MKGEGLWRILSLFFKDFSSGCGDIAVSSSSAQKISQTVFWGVVGEGFEMEKQCNYVCSSESSNLQEEFENPSKL